MESTDFLQGATDFSFKFSMWNNVLAIFLKKYEYYYPGNTKHFRMNSLNWLNLGFSVTFQKKCEYNMLINILYVSERISEFFFSNVLMMYAEPYKITRIAFDQTF